MPEAKRDPQATSPQREEAAESHVVDVDYDGATWTVDMDKFAALDYLDCLYLAQTTGRDAYMVGALRILLGAEQASRFFGGREVKHLIAFYDAIGEASGAGNP